MIGIAACFLYAAAICLLASNIRTSERRMAQRQVYIEALTDRIEIRKRRMARVEAGESACKVFAEPMPPLPLGKSTHKI